MVAKLGLTVQITSRTHMFFTNSCVMLQTSIKLKFDENTSLRFVFDMMCDRCLGQFTLYTLVSTRLISSLYLLCGTFSGESLLKLLKIDPKCLNAIFHFT
jgi:hypothetical protein